MSKYKLELKRGGFELSEVLNRAGKNEMRQILWRFNFRKPYGYHRIKK